MKKTIEQLEKELEDLKTSHRSQWDTYGSELCAGDMIRQEEELEKKIANLKATNIGLKQLREIKEETKKRWEKLGLLK